MEHIGGYHFYREALAVMCNNSRNGNSVYAGWTSVGLHKGKDSVWALTDEELERVIHQTGRTEAFSVLISPIITQRSSRRILQEFKGLISAKIARKNPRS